MAGFCDAGAGLQAPDSLGNRGQFVKSLQPRPRIFPFWGDLTGDRGRPRLRGGACTASSRIFRLGAGGSWLLGGPANSACARSPHSRRGVARQPQNLKIIGKILSRNRIRYCKISENSNADGGSFFLLESCRRVATRSWRVRAWMIDAREKFGRVTPIL
jgi:hypothetical protein